LTRHLLGGFLAAPFPEALEGAAATAGFAMGEEQNGRHECQAPEGSAVCQDLV
jgi:hypothetical protein